MTKPSKTLSAIVDVLHATQSDVINSSFVKPGNVANTISDIIKNDTSFEEKNGVFFEAGKDAFETAERFTEIHVDQYHNKTRPSLPALAIHHAEKLDLDKDSPEYKAMILVAMRAELKQANMPDYHSKNHYADVTAVAANLVHTNNDMVADGNTEGVPLSKSEQALVVIAAIGHDLDHDGNGNPEGDIYFNEEKSFTAMVPLLEQAGIDQNQMTTIHSMLLTTSPNGPHGILKAAAKSFRKEGKVDWDKVDPKGEYPELKNMANNRPLTEMASMLSDADLYASSGAGLKSNEVMSKMLTDEVQNSGVKMDFTTHTARKFFLENIVGSAGYASGAGRKNGNASFQKLRKDTNDLIEHQKKIQRDRPPAGPS